jgi:host factor-I protein
MAKKKLQDAFLAHLVAHRSPTTIFLTNGVKLSGIVTFVDEDCLTLSRDGVTQLVMKHAISTVMPQDSFTAADVLAD